MCPAKQILIPLCHVPVRVMERIRKALPRVHIRASEILPEKTISKLLVRHDGGQIKIEVTPVLRGCVYEPELRAVSPAVEATFGFAEIQVVSFGDLNAGKIVAALDRQHPRDLFDIPDLLSNEGIDAALRHAFVVYLISHNGLIAELIAPKEKSIAQEFTQGFEGMTAVPVSNRRSNSSTGSTDHLDYWRDAGRTSPVPAGL